MLFTFHVSRFAFHASTQASPKTSAGAKIPRLKQLSVIAVQEDGAALTVEEEVAVALVLRLENCPIDRDAAAEAREFGLAREKTRHGIDFEFEGGTGVVADAAAGAEVDCIGERGLETTATEDDQ